MKFLAAILAMLCATVLADGIFNDFAGDQEVMSRTLRTAPVASCVMFAAPSAVAPVNPNIDDALAIDIRIHRPTPLWTFTINGSDGTNPVNLPVSAPMTNMVRLSWLTRTGKVYTVQASGDLQTWSNCVPTVPGTGQRATNHFSTAFAAAFYRLTSN